MPLREVFEVSTRLRRGPVGFRFCRPRPTTRTAAARSRRTNVPWSGWYTCAGTTLAADFGISVGTAHAYTAAVIGLLADRAPDLLRARREANPAYVLLDDTLAYGGRLMDDDNPQTSAGPRAHTDPTNRQPLAVAAREPV